MVCRCRVLLLLSIAATVLLVTLPLATAAKKTPPPHHHPLTSSSSSLVAPKRSGHVPSLTTIPRKNNNVSPISLSHCRGGSTDPPSASYGDRPPPYPPQSQQQPPQQPLPQQPPQQDPYLENDQLLDYDNNNNVPFQEETFQDKVDSWREYQRQHAAEYQSNVTPRDEKGRMKLLTSVSKGSRAITFFIYMWRCVHLYERVDQTRTGIFRFMGVLPLTFLFVANMAGVVASITSPGHGTKRRLKAILNLDKLLELFMILSSLVQLIFAPQNSMIPRELYISHILHSVFFITQCQAVTRFVWDDGIPAANSQRYNTMPRDDNEPLMMERANPNDPYRY